MRGRVNARGEWRTEDTRTDGRVAGFHLPGLCSPWLGSADIARRKAAARDDPSMKVYVNTILALPWTEAGEAPDWQRLYDRREDDALPTVQAGGVDRTSVVWGKRVSGRVDRGGRA